MTTKLKVNETIFNLGDKIRFKKEINFTPSYYENYGMNPEIHNHDNVYTVTHVEFHQYKNYSYVCLLNKGNIENESE